MVMKVKVGVQPFFRVEKPGRGGAGGGGRKTISVYRDI